MFTFLSLMYLYNTYCFNATTILPLQVLQQEDFEPPTRTLMLKCIRKPKWEEAEQAELKSIQKCNVWTKNPQPPGMAPSRSSITASPKSFLEQFIDLSGVDLCGIEDDHCMIHHENIAPTLAMDTYIPAHDHASAHGP